MTAKSSFLDKVLGRLGRLDAEDLQKVVERLAGERNFLETLFNTIEDGILVADSEGRLVYANRAVGHLLALKPGAAEGLSIRQILPELDWESIAALDRANGPAVVRHEIEVSYPRPRLLRLLAAPLGRTHTLAGGVALVLHDATEARKQTFEAIESERVQALTLLAASVAHEIGNPLNALHIHLQLMERELRKLRSVAAERTGRKPARGRGRAAVGAAAEAGEALQVANRLGQYLAVAKGEIARLDYTVTQFLQAIRPAPPHIQAASLNRTVGETLAVLRPELENRGLIVEEELGRQLPDAAFDPAQIQQALTNLIRNSMQAMTRGGVLRLQTGRTAEGVWVTVADTGIGIPEEVLRRLFEPFFTTKKKGSGLGLMIVHRIMRDHAGRIEIESPPGKGTTFRLWLPLHERRPRLLEASPAPEPTPPIASQPGEPSLPEPPA